MVVGVDEGRKHEGARPGRGLRSFRNRGDHAVVVPQHGVVEQTAVGAREQAGCRDFRRHDRQLPLSLQFVIYTSSRSPRGGRNSRVKISEGVGVRVSW